MQLLILAWDTSYNIKHDNDKFGKEITTCTHKLHYVPWLKGQGTKCTYWVHILIYIKEYLFIELCHEEVPHPTVFSGCNYLSLPEIPVSGINSSYHIKHDNGKIIMCTGKVHYVPWLQVQVTISTSTFSKYFVMKRFSNTIITRTTFGTLKYPRWPRDQYTAQIVNTLELSAPHPIELKKPLQPGNQPGEVSNNKYMYICSSKKWSHYETVALWNSLGTCKTSSIPLRCQWKPNCQRRSSLSLVAVLLIPLVCHAHLHQYPWFGRIFSAVANRYRKSASLLKWSVSIISIS